LMQIVKSYFAAINIDMEIRTMDSAAWINYVGVGHKHDALAQRSGGSLGHLYEPTRQLTRFQTKGASNWLMISDPVIDAWQSEAMAATDVDGIKQVLIDANKYIAQQHVAISLLQVTVFGLYQPWLKGWTGQYLGVPGPSDPLMMNFYQARFWIDANLKRAMGD